MSETVRSVLLSKIESGSLALPSMPGVALKVIRTLEDRDGALAAVVPIVETCPITTAEVIRQANAAANGRRVASVEQAVTRLGQLRLMRIAVEISVREFALSKKSAISGDFRAIWDHSVATAIAARDLAKLANYAEPELAYLGGLLHDIGKIVCGDILLYVEATTDRLPANWADWWLEVVGSVHRPVGIAVAKAWELPPEVVAGVEDIADYDPAEPASAPNLVRLANALAKKAGLYAGPVDATELDALILVGTQLLGVDAAAVDALAGELPARVAAATGE
ncbi:MAG: HDOD domain-containing protein [Deltaproteobacteria bacterium]|nr:MAG: HDOD domain-containing protein [Deltaproteobacteria bacterium]